MTDGLLDRIGELGVGWLIALAFILPFGETVFLLDLVIPGEVGLVLIGAAAGRADVSLALVIVVGAFGAFAGDSTSYMIGRTWGRSVIERWAPIRRRFEPVFDSAKERLDRHGARYIVLARFVGALRAVMPLVAGTTQMRKRVFFPANAFASAAWVTLVVLLGAGFGEAAAPLVDRFGLAISAVVVAGLIASALLRHSRSSREQSELPS